MVSYETLGTKPLFHLFKEGFTRNLFFTEPKKGSEVVPKGRSFFGSVKYLFFLECGCNFLPYILQHFLSGRVSQKFASQNDEKPFLWLYRPKFDILWFEKNYNAERKFVVFLSKVLG
jgi:hypothetical protein